MSDRVGALSVKFPLEFFYTEVLHTVHNKSDRADMRCELLTVI